MKIIKILLLVVTIGFGLYVVYMELWTRGMIPNLVSTVTHPVSQYFLVQRAEKEFGRDYVKACKSTGGIMEVSYSQCKYSTGSCEEKRQKGGNMCLFGAPEGGIIYCDCGATKCWNGNACEPL